MRYAYLIGCLCLYGTTAFAQLPIDSTFQRAVDHQTRTLVGLPGKQYWQNRADYTIQVDFEPKSRLLSGEADIVYENNSPDTLKQLWFKLYPNLYKKGVKTKSRIAKSDQGDGVRIERLWINNKRIGEAGIRINGTNMVVNVPEIMPGQKTKVTVRYHYTLNAGSHMRTGQVDKGSYFIAYFFPRIAVYDDIDGWNQYPYTGEEEFYNDFCRFKVKIKVPKDYVVWATGDLLNAKQVLHPVVQRRLKEVEKSQDQVVTLIGKEDLAQGKAVKQRGKQSFEYEADEVVDFAFGLSNHYVWKAANIVVDSTSKRKTRVDAVFNPQHRDYEEVIDFAVKTVKGMSFTFPAWPFPYAHMTVFDGLDQMEYPMMANDNPTKNREDGITLTNHEIFHTLFPFYMGINETKFGWMDEGWATIGEWKLSKLVDSTYVDDYGMKETSKSSGDLQDTPIMTLTPDLKGIGTFTDSYPKPALGYLFVEEYLGEKRFKNALHHYIRNWHGKHPQPLDFFNAMNTGAGESLNWFWKPWFYDDGVLDLAITAVDKKEDGYGITIENKSRKPLPVHLSLYYTDGSKMQVNQSIAVWKRGDTQVVLPIRTKKKIQKVILGDTYIPDKHTRDNIYILK